MGRQRASPLPAHGQRCKAGTLVFAGCDPRGRDCRFHLNALLPEARVSPEVKTCARTGYRVKIGGLHHQDKPASRAIREGLDFIRHVLAIAPIEEGRQVYLRA